MLCWCTYYLSIKSFCQNADEIVLVLHNIGLCVKLNQNQFFNTQASCCSVGMLLKRNLKTPPRSSFGILRPPIFHPKKIEGPPISPPPPLQLKLWLVPYVGVPQLMRTLPTPLSSATMLGTRIKPVTVAKDLGVYIDCRLNFNEHITKTASDCMFKITTVNRIKHLLD